MTNAHSPIVCKACQRKYNWKPQLAGRTVRCKCGQSIHIADESPTTESPTTNMDQTSPPVAAATGTTCRSCNEPMPGDAIVCVHCGFNSTTGKMMAVASFQAANTRTALPIDQESGSSVRQSLLPLCLLIVGLGLMSFNIAKPLVEGTDLGSLVWPAALGIAAVIVVFETVILVIAAIIGTKVADVSFGTIPSTIFKLAALSASVGGVVQIFGLSAGALGCFGVLLTVGLYALMLAWLFEFDMWESFVLAIVFAVVKFLLMVGLVVGVLGLL